MTTKIKQKRRNQLIRIQFEPSIHEKLLNSNNNMLSINLELLSGID